MTEKERVMSMILACISGLDHIEKEYKDKFPIGTYGYSKWKAIPDVKSLAEEYLIELNNK